MEKIIKTQNEITYKWKHQQQQQNKNSTILNEIKLKLAPLDTLKNLYVYFYQNKKLRLCIQKQNQYIFKCNRIYFLFIVHRDIVQNICGASEKFLFIKILF